MNTALHVTIPSDLRLGVQQAIETGKFSSVDDLVRIAILKVLPKPKARKKQKSSILYYEVTPEFEKEILEAQKEPLEGALVWDGKGSFTEFCQKHTK